MVLFKLHRHRVIFYCLLLLQKKGRFCWGQETCALYAETVQKNPIVITQMSNTISVTGFLLIFFNSPIFSGKSWALLQILRFQLASVERRKKSGHFQSLITFYVKGKRHFCCYKNIFLIWLLYDAIKWVFLDVGRSGGAHTATNCK